MDLIQSNPDILVIEDKSAEAIAIEKSLKSFNCQVWIANSLKEARVKIAELKPDLILMDKDLEWEIDGIKAKSKIIHDFEIPVVYIVSDSLEGLGQKRLTESYGYIIKPYHKSLVQKTIKMALRLHEMEIKYNKVSCELSRSRRAARIGKIGLWENNLANNDLYWSEEMYNILGYPKQHPLNLKDVIRIFPPEELKRFQKAVDDAVYENVPYSMDYKIIRQDGSVGYIHDEGEVIRNEIGEPEVMFGTTQDITTRKQVENSLNESEENFRAIAENANDGILIAAGGGNYVYANPRAVEITGYTKEKLLNTRIEDLTHPDDSRKVIENFKSRINGKYVSPAYETRLIRKNDTVVPIEITAAKTVWNSQPAVMIIIRDISKLRETEIKLKRNEERFRAVAESAVDGIITTDVYGKILFCNDSFKTIFGYLREELIGKNLTVLMPERYRKSYLKQLELYQKAGSHKHIGKVVTTNGMRKNGEEFPFEMSLAAWKSEKNTYFTSIIRDITVRKKAENELIESENRYRDLVELMPLIIFETDLVGNITFVNRITSEITGYSKKDLNKGINLFEVLVPEDYDKARKNFHKILGGKNSGGTEYTAIKKNGTKLDALVFTNAIIRENKVLGVRGVVLDMTDLKRMEDSIKRSEHRLKELLNNMANGVAVYQAADDREDFIIVNINRAGASITDVKGSDVLGKRVTEVYPGIKDFGLLKVLKRVWSTGKPEHYPVSHYKDHRIDVWIDNYVYKLPSGEVVAVFDDVTDRKHAEDAQKKSERQLNDIINHLPDATFAIDGDKNIIAWNKAIEELTGVKASEMIGKSDYEYTIPFYGNRRPALIDLIFKSDEEIEENHYNNIIKSGNALMAETRVSKLGNKILWAKASPLYDEDGELIGAIESIRDITELRKAENDIKKALTEKELLLKEIHHRVKNNLQIISSLLDLQEEYVKEDPKAVNVLHESQNRVISMALIHELLYQSKDLSHINFSEYIKNLISHLFYSYGIKSNITTMITIEEIFLNIETAVPCGLIISELVSNSLKYAYPHDSTGKILISLKKTNQHKFELIIADEGRGLPEELDFRNIKSSLGLKLVNSLVEQLDGSIELDRSKGTQFTIIFTELKYKKRL